ncbi:2'-5' RNA ligase [Desulfitobacterium dehalogenans ATCC 51507]|uniref:RNA 2',3'-cyclic phosphodiesterase n=1 Tax=Desulfitobacterium dehalogenans (strain ATCC 51507 / DSM 9161 / JW/IU-DC1) TaxID=756499 RepID=I4A8C4_DESDJ|nr:RNA 2',3'-cyclic phosphodiesterase [Desulfitobacterium dehalogenans]AFM00209.1 2'-5' RNA ligase [Desulfitobacterium dehalogenans ATCC 51507]
MRAFVGIDFTEEIKDEIYGFQQKLKGYAQRGRWKHRDNFHLTLKFLDEISPAQKTDIDEALLRLCQRESPFNLELKGLGVFTGKESIRVLWLGLAGDIQEMESLHQKVSQALVLLGFPPERRRFSPHITLGQDIVFEGGFEEINAKVEGFEFSPTHVERIHLFKSEQIQFKRIYTKISEYPLG